MLAHGGDVMHRESLVSILIASSFSQGAGKQDHQLRVEGPGWEVLTSEGAKA